MPGAKSKDRPMCKSLAELNIIAGQVKMDNVKPKLVVNTAQKMLTQAEKSLKEGDEEKSYIMYMRYMAAVQVIKRHPEYKSSSTYYENMTGGKKAFVKALDEAERLGASLKKRYELLQLSRDADKRAMENEKKEATETEKQLKKKDKQKNIASNLLNLPEVPNSKLGSQKDMETTISCTKLKSLLCEKSTSFLILDARPASDFATSHIKNSCIINVPQEAIVPGITAQRLASRLPPESQEQWQRRGTVDLIILLDWKSSGPDVIPKTTLHTLKDILLQWDTDVKYKTDPLVLDGGYEEWLMTYPMLTTNPQATIPAHLINNEDALALEKLLDNIEYPNLYDAFTAQITVASTPKPAFDRATKPRLLDYQSVDNNVKFMDNTVSNENLDIQRFTDIKLDNKLSDIDGRVLNPKISNAAVNSTLSSEDLKSSGHVINIKVPPPPSVDRTLKAPAAILYEERAKEMEVMLKEKENMANTSVELENARLEKEREWELVRLKREKEMEEEMKLELQRKEEDLIASLQKLEEEQKQKDLENEALKKRIENYKRMEKEWEAVELRREAEMAQLKEEKINKRIKEKEDERKRIKAEREVLAKERQDKELLVQLEQERKKRAGEEQKKAEEAKLRLREIKPSPSASQIVPGSPGKGTYFTKLKPDSLAIPPSTSSSNMKRSHSSPNIAQMMEDEDADVVTNLPMFDRTIKPLHKPLPGEVYAARQRNFLPVWGKVGRGLTGLKNLGNTCYMNSIVQCINNTTHLAKYFCAGYYRNDVNPFSKVTQGEIAEEVAAVVRALWTGQYRSIGCRDLKIAAGKYHKAFQGNDQQDSHEFLTILMDWLHEDLNKVRQKSPMVEQNNTNIDDVTAANNAWDEFKKSNESMIVSLFYGQLKSTVRCLTCNKKSVTFEPFFNLSLPLPPNNNRCTLKECFQLYVRGESISGYSCPVCKEKRDAIKNFDIWRLPPVLIIHLQRFYNDGWWRKRQAYVDFELKDMDLRSFICHNPQKHTQYNLYGVSNHYGTMEGGHYTAYCKSPVYDKWYRFDDHEVDDLTPAEVKSSAAYILFYSTSESDIPEIS